MPTVQRNAQVPYTAAQMFELVNDIESYPQFLHWCSGARVESRHRNTIEATLEIGVLGFHRNFRTRNTAAAPGRIQIDLVSGPFRKLRGEWRFNDLEGGGSEVSLVLAFEVAAGPFGMMFAKVFEELAGSQMTAFIDRAKTLYG